jgi:hypothetical protein
MIQLWNKNHRTKKNFWNHDHFDSKISKGNQWFPKKCASQNSQRNHVWFPFCNRANNCITYQLPMQARDVENSISTHPFEASRELGVANAEGSKIPKYHTLTTIPHKIKARPWLAPNHNISPTCHCLIPRVIILHASYCTHS